MANPSIPPESKTARVQYFLRDQQSLRVEANSFLAINRAEMEFMCLVCDVIAEHASVINTRLGRLEALESTQEVARLYPRAWRSPSMLKYHPKAHETRDELAEEKATGISLKGRHFRDLIEYWAEEGMTHLEDKRLVSDAKSAISAFVIFEKHPELVDELIKAVESVPPVEQESPAAKQHYADGLKNLRTLRKWCGDGQNTFQTIQVSFNELLAEAEELHKAEVKLGYVQSPLSR